MYIHGLSLFKVLYILTETGKKKSWNDLIKHTESRGTGKWLWYHQTRYSSWVQASIIQKGQIFPVAIKSAEMEKRGDAQAKNLLLQHGSLNQHRQASFHWPCFHFLAYEHKPHKSLKEFLKFSILYPSHSFWLKFLGNTWIITCQYSEGLILPQVLSTPVI